MDSSYGDDLDDYDPKELMQALKPLPQLEAIVEGETN